MHEDSIVHFVGFITSLDFDKFIQRWDYFVQQHKKDSRKSILQVLSGSKGKFKYLSQHPGSGADFKFTFMNKRESEHFPEHNVKVVHMGGYLPLQVESSRQDQISSTKIVVFVRNPEADLSVYKQLPLFKKLNIYQAYYENCSYSFVLEYFVKEADAPLFLGGLHPGLRDEISIYEECSLLASKNQTFS
jgi:hypothetical protein